MPFIQQTESQTSKESTVSKGINAQRKEIISKSTDKNPYIATTFKGKVNTKNNKILVIWHRETQGTVLRQTDSDT